MILKRVIALFTTVLCLAAPHATMAQDKVLKVGSTPTGVPFTFLDTKTNSIQGIMVDLIQAIGADATMAVAELFDLLFGQRDGKVAIVQHDEVIAGAVHFGEGESHRRKIRGL